MNLLELKDDYVIAVASSDNLSKKVSWTKLVIAFKEKRILGRELIELLTLTGEYYE